MNPKIDKYLIDGCMRCKYGATPDCKVNNWKVELETLRQIVLDIGLTEELKWGVPCYTFENKNVLILSAFKDYVCISFLKGVLLMDDEKILIKPGEHSQSARIIKYTNPEQIIFQSLILKAYILEAIEIEKSNKKVEFKHNPEPIPEELIEIFTHDFELRDAFYSLTQGKQRGYIIYFSQPKQSKSRFNRIEKCRLKILNGEGLQEKKY